MACEYCGREVECGRTGNCKSCGAPIKSKPVDYNGCVAWAASLWGFHVIKPRIQQIAAQQQQQAAYVSNAYAQAMYNKYLGQMTGGNF